MPERFRETSLRGGRAAADQLEYVWIALLRHDRGAGRERVRQLHEREFLRIEQQHVGSEAPEILHQQGDLEEHLRFGLAARELHRRHRLMGRSKAELLSRAVAIEWQARACRSPPRSRADSSRAGVARAAALPRHRVSRRRSHLPTAGRSSASPAACGCSRAVRCSLRAWRADPSASATPTAPVAQRLRRHRAGTSAAP